MNITEIKVYNIFDENWAEIRPDVAELVTGFRMYNRSKTDISITLSKIKPGGTMFPHIDGYTHLLYFMSGTGTLNIDGKVWNISPGIVAEIPAGREHSYTNSSDQDIVMLTCNLY